MSHRSEGLPLRIENATVPKEPTESSKTTFPVPDGHLRINDFTNYQPIPDLKFHSFKCIGKLFLKANGREGRSSSVPKLISDSEIPKVVDTQLLDADFDKVFDITESRIEYPDYKKILYKWLMDTNFFKNVQEKVYKHPDFICDVGSGIGSQLATYFQQMKTYRSLTIYAAKYMDSVFIWSDVKKSESKESAKQHLHPRFRCKKYKSLVTLTDEQPPGSQSFNDDENSFVIQEVTFGPHQLLMMNEIHAEENQDGQESSWVMTRFFPEQEMCNRKKFFKGLKAKYLKYWALGVVCGVNKFVIGHIQRDGLSHGSNILSIDDVLKKTKLNAREVQEAFQFQNRLLTWIKSNFKENNPNIVKKFRWKTTGSDRVECFKVDKKYLSDGMTPFPQLVLNEVTERFQRTSKINVGVSSIPKPENAIISQLNVHLSQDPSQILLNELRTKSNPDIRRVVSILKRKRELESRVKVLEANIKRLREENEQLSKNILKLRLLGSKEEIGKNSEAKFSSCDSKSNTTLGSGQRSRNDSEKCNKTSASTAPHEPESDPFIIEDANLLGTFHITQDNLSRPGQDILEEEVPDIPNLTLCNTPPEMIQKSLKGQAGNANQTSATTATHELERLPFIIEDANLPQFKEFKCIGKFHISRDNKYICEERAPEIPKLTLCNSLQEIIKSLKVKICNENQTYHSTGKKIQFFRRWISENDYFERLQFKIHKKPDFICLGRDVAEIMITALEFGYRDGEGAWEIYAAKYEDIVFIWREETLPLSEDRSLYDFIFKSLVTTGERQNTKTRTKNFQSEVQKSFIIQEVAFGSHQLLLANEIQAENPKWENIVVDTEIGGTKMEYSTIQQRIELVKIKTEEKCISKWAMDRQQQKYWAEGVVCGADKLVQGTLDSDGTLLSIDILDMHETLENTEWPSASIASCYPFQYWLFTFIKSQFTESNPNFVKKFSWRSPIYPEVTWTVVPNKSLPDDGITE